MRVTVFGANGATGRLLSDQALQAGHTVLAVTRSPGAFPLRGDGLRVLEGDVRDLRSVERAVEGADAVLSTLGVPFSRQPIDLYSTAASHLVHAMSTEGVKRLVVVSSSATRPHNHAEGGFLLNRVVQPLVTATIGRTTYEDMRRMEDLVHASDLAWTVMRPSGLFDHEVVTDYRVDEEQAPGAFTARGDLAASMVEQLTDERFVHANVAVTTTAVRPSLVGLLLREARTTR